MKSTAPEGVVDEPVRRHRCNPPRYRPENEWRGMPAPPGWVRPADRERGARLTLPTEYRPGTVWVCECGRGWIRRPGRHYGRNPNFGHREGTWGIVPWYACRIRRRIKAYRLKLAYKRDKAIVDGFVLPSVGASTRREE